MVSGRQVMMAAPQQTMTRQVMMSAPPQQVVTEQVQVAAPEPQTMMVEQMVQPPPKKELRTVQKSRPKTVMTTEQVTTTTQQTRTVPKLVYDVRTITVPTVVTETTRVRSETMFDCLLGAWTLPARRMIGDCPNEKAENPVQHRRRGELMAHADGVSRCLS